MLKYFVLTLMAFYSVSSFGTNSGGTFSVKPGLTGKNIVFKTGQTHDSVLFKEGKPSSGKWIIESRSVRDQDLRSENALKAALEQSSESGSWAPVSN